MLGLSLSEMKNKKSQWLVILKTDLALSEEEINILHQKRWIIEVFLKMVKQAFLLSEEKVKELLSYFVNRHPIWLGIKLLLLKKYE
jgi:hypothetical protein